MSRKVTILILALLIFPFGKSIHAQSDINNAQAIFIYNFLSHIKWPDASVGNKYTIGVIGKTSTAGYLENYTAKRKVGSKPIEVIRYGSVEEVGNCQVLLVSYGKSGQIQALQQKMTGKSCLIIGEKPGTTKSGASIDFNVVDGKLRYKIDRANAQAQNLYLSAALIQMSM